MEVSRPMESVQIGSCMNTPWMKKSARKLLGWRWSTTILFLIVISLHLSLRSGLPLLSVIYGSFYYLIQVVDWPKGCISDHFDLNCGALFFLFFYICLQDTYVLCRITKRDGKVDGETISAPSEEINDQKVVKDLDSSRHEEVQKDESIPSDSIEDLELWLKELIDPNFDGYIDFSSEPPSSLEPTNELQVWLDSYCCWKACLSLTNGLIRDLW